MEDKIYIGLVEDQSLFREGLKAILDSWPQLEVIFESGDGFSVIPKLQQAARRPDVMLVDLSLPSDGDNEFSGVHVTDAVIRFFPEIKIIILSIHQDESFIAQLIEHGAHGYLIKDCDPAELREAIFSVHEKGSYINERTLKAIQNNIGKKNKLAASGNLNVQFTRREKEILNLICQQLTSEEIAEKLFISVKTVHGHRNNLLQKTNSRNVAGLVVYALKYDMADPLTFGNRE
ncbi:MAG: response regulator transcription factor [Bacteroidota bacterium]|nr:response regulator transcription factor [Bacteroidota bacterium]